MIVASLGSFHSPHFNGCLEFSNCLVILKYHTVMSLFLLHRIVE